MLSVLGDSVASPLVWVLTLVVTIVLLFVDLVVIARRPHEPTMAEATRHLAFFIGLAVLFGAGVWLFAEPNALSSHPGPEFFAGWLTEYSLSIDNLFIFIIIMANFSVPRQYQQAALMIGIVLALVMRGAFILVGAAAINQFSWIFYVFGAFLLWTATKLAREGRNRDDEEDYQENRVVRFAERHLPATSEYDGTRLFTRADGKRLVTPMFLVVLTLGTTDLLFALDSIPAIYGLTSDPYLVLTANVFALMGLRQLYFLIGGLLQRLIYLSYGLAVLLGFIGVKLVLHALHENELPFLNGGEPVDWAPDIPIWLSLVVIVGTLAVTAVVSLAASRNMSQEEIEQRTISLGEPEQK
ncbi:TerC family protein [Nocardioides panaciterrulae]|uniref:Tellurite resistance protein TerC n=1 Tax=Nocardioides panaciterrulae TaxID=661492 RepID=A0A7Y9E4B5_9ACTN|nr:TerC family protein [Nocardioides panaciterrulae]NYD40715.1 tellurite resistance protein TerC [Nocardioides panaciterrulae]